MNDTLAITDCRISEKCQKGLESFGFKVLKLPLHPRLSEAVSGHVDMLFFKYRDTVITTAEYFGVAKDFFAELKRLRPKLKITLCADKLKAEYPDDCKLNALCIEDRLVCKSDTVLESILDFAKSHAISVISVKQGYPACTVLAPSFDAVITSDGGVASVLSNYGAKVTLIKNGGISLPPYDYGFIGGCSGVYESTVYFLGDITTHPSAEIITDTLTKAGFDFVSLSDEGLRDLGGIVFV